MTAVEVDRHVLPLLRSTIDDAGDAAARTHRRGRRDGARLARAARRRTGVDARREPSVQRRDAAHHRPARHGVVDHQDARDGAAGGGRAARGAARVSGVRDPVGTGRVLGDGPDRRPGRARRVPAPAPGRVGAGRHRTPAGARGVERPGPPVRPGAGRVRAAAQDAAPVAGRPRRPRGVRGRRHRADRTRRGAVDRGLGPPDRRVRLVLRLVAFGRMLAFAKLTVSLRVTGVREDGYHLIDAEMVSLDLADEITFADGDGLRISGADVDAGEDNLVRRALRAVGRTAHVRARQADPGGRGARGWVIGRGGGPALGRGGRPRGRGVDRRRCAVLRARGPGPGPGHRRGGRGPAVRGPDLHAADAAVRLLDGRGLPGVGCARRADRAGRQRSRAGGAAHRAPPGRVARQAGRRDRPGSAAGRQRQHLVRGRCVPRRGAGGGPGRAGVVRAGDVRAGPYLPARRCQRVRFSIFLCFFLRMRLRRFLIREPMSAGQPSGVSPERTTRRLSTFPRDPALDLL